MGLPSLYEDILEKIRENLAALYAESREAQKTFLEIRREIDALIEICNSIIDEIKELSKRRPDSLKMENIGLRARNQKLIDERRRIKNNLAKTESENRRLSSSLEKLRQNNAELQNQLAKSNSRLRAVRAHGPTARGTLIRESTVAAKTTSSYL